MSMCCYKITIVWLEIARLAPTPPLISLAHTASCTPSTRLLALTVDSWHRITTPPINLSRCPTLTTGLLSTTPAWRPGLQPCVNCHLPPPRVSDVHVVSTTITVMLRPPTQTLLYIYLLLKSLMKPWSPALGGSSSSPGVWTDDHVFLSLH